MILPSLVFHGNQIGDIFGKYLWGGCRGCGNQLTGTYHEMTRLARLLSPPQATPFTVREQRHLSGGRSVWGLSLS